MEIFTKVLGKDNFLLVHHPKKTLAVITEENARAELTQWRKSELWKAIKKERTDCGRVHTAVQFCKYNPFSAAKQV